MSEPQIARSLYMIPVDEIDASGGLRPLDMAWVEGLAGLMKRDGQRRPIEIYKSGAGYRMIAGRHRLAAAVALGWTTIDADILDGAALDRRASEVSENLFRLNLSPLDRAAFVAEQIAIEKALAGLEPDASVKSVLATARWADRIGAEADDASLTMRLAFGFSEQVAEKVGLSRQTIYRDLELHRGIRPDVAAAIRGLPVAGNAAQLRTLARLPEGQQRAVAELLTEGTAKGVSDALATLSQHPVRSPDQKHWNAFLGAWSRMSRKTRKLALIGILEHASTEPEFKALRAQLSLEGDDATALDILLARPGGELVVQPIPVDGPVSRGRRTSQGVRSFGDRGGTRTAEAADRSGHGRNPSAEAADESLTTPTFGGDT